MALLKRRSVTFGAGGKPVGRPKTLDDWEDRFAELAARNG